MDQAVGSVETPTSQPSRGQPVPLAPVEPDGLVVLLKRSTEAGEATAAETVAAAFSADRSPPLATGQAILGSVGAIRSALRAGVLGLPRPMSRPDDPAHSPMPRPAFVSLPRPGAGQAMAAEPEPQLIEPPRLVRDSTAPEFIMPIDKGRVTSMFNQGRYHPAIDLAAPLGTPVHATTRKQRVTFAGRRGGYGNLVVTRDPSGRQHYYGHLQRIVAAIG
ncbi:MAG: M23 family metallopeptidase, partial [Hyphomicrobiaceae bacterium]|nr:M23 family metallopeptidase [Hyphomicrobiaceae bacterium]